MLMNLAMSSPSCTLASSSSDCDLYGQQVGEVGVRGHVHVEVLGEGGGLLGRVRVDAGVALHLHQVLVMVGEVLAVRGHGGRWGELEERPE